jgi:hypothetical protein
MRFDRAWLLLEQNRIVERLNLDPEAATATQWRRRSNVAVVTEKQRSHPAGSERRDAIRACGSPCS